MDKLLLKSDDDGQDRDITFNIPSMVHSAESKGVYEENIRSFLAHVTGSANSSLLYLGSLCDDQW